MEKLERGVITDEEAFTRKKIITCIYPTESGGRSKEVAIISYGAIATSHLLTIKYKYLVSKVRV